MSNNWENKILGKIFNEKEGKIVERGCLSVVNKKNYQQNTERSLYNFYIKKIDFNLYKYFNNYLEQNPNKNFESFLIEIQKENLNQIEQLKKTQGKVEKIMNERVRGERLRFLEEIEIEEQFKIVENSQGEDFEPSEPKTKFANDLHATIAERIELENFEDLEYYTAIDTYLDNCGVDAFFKFKYQDKQGKEKFIRVCFDLTTNTPEGKTEQQTKKNEAREIILTDVVLFLSNDEVEKIKKIYTNRNKKEAKSNENFQSMREDYRSLLNNFAEIIITNYKKRRD